MSINASGSPAMTLARRIIALRVQVAQMHGAYLRVKRERDEAIDGLHRLRDELLAARLNGAGDAQRQGGYPPTDRL